MVHSKTMTVVLRKQELYYEKEVPVLEPVFAQNSVNPCNLLHFIHLRQQTSEEVLPVAS